MKSKRLLIILFVLSGLLFVSSPFHKIHAWNPFPGPEEFKQDNDQAITADGISISPTAGYVNGNLVNWLYCVIAGGPAACPEALLAMNPGFGLVPQAANANIAMIHNQPVGLGLWIADTGRTLGFLPKQTMAQGVGFSGLSPILDMWKIFRNIAYLLLSFSLIVVGFMVMFRRKIDPQTVVTIQDALPRVIISLILITFSYAIVALLIDVLYVVLLLAYGIFSTGNLLPDTRATTGLLGTPTTSYQTRDVFLNGSVNDAIGIIFPNNFSDFGALVERILGTSITTWSAGVGTGAGSIAGLAGGGLGFLGGAVVGGALGAFAGPAIIQLLVAILIAILMIRLFFMFLAAYVQIILRLILGPVQIALGVIPGTDGFGGWIRAVIAQLSVFGTAGIMFMLATVFAIISENSAGSTDMWKAPYLPGIGSTESISALFSIGILMLIPTIVKQVQQTIIGQHGHDLPLGGAIMGGFSGIAALGMQVFNLGLSEHHNRQLKEAMSQGVGIKGGGEDHGPKK